MTIRFVDLFAGIGGTRIGFQNAVANSGMSCECVFSSEIKPHAVAAYGANFGDTVAGDITQIDPGDLPNFDYLLAGFPCQPFSAAGNRDGLLDIRGTLFFNILQILEAKRPQGFMLENVPGLATHKGGATLDMMLKSLKNTGYKVNSRILDSSDFGVPQKRKRLYIVGDRNTRPEFLPHGIVSRMAGEFIDYNAPVEPSDFGKLLGRKFSKEDLQGKSIKDKRGGESNIPSWVLEMKGKVNKRQSLLLNEISKQRRHKHWAIPKGIAWMDGMPLTCSEIRTFSDYPELEDDLEYLLRCGYLVFEYPKKLVVNNGINRRVYKTDAEKGYNIVAGKLSFPITKILHPDQLVPTIVATEPGRIAVATDKGVRRITIEEGLRFSGFPANYSLGMLTYNEAYDLLGNTVIPPVIEYVTLNLLRMHKLE